MCIVKIPVCFHIRKVQDGGHMRKRALRFSTKKRCIILVPLGKNMNSHCQPQY